VSKSIYVIAGLGLLSCIVMSMMMQHVLKVKKDEAVPPAVKDIQDLYGSQLSRLCTIKVDERPEHTRIDVGVWPQGGLSNSSQARNIGQFVWRRYAVRQVVDEVVVTLHPTSGEAVEINVEAPLLARRKLRHEPATPPAPAGGVPPAPADVPGRAPPPPPPSPPPASTPR